MSFRYAQCKVMSQAEAAQNKDLTELVEYSSSLEQIQVAQPYAAYIQRHNFYNSCMKLTTLVMLASIAAAFYLGQLQFYYGALTVLVGHFYLFQKTITVQEAMRPLELPQPLAELLASPKIWRVIRSGVAGEEVLVQLQAAQGDTHYYNRFRWRGFDHPRLQTAFSLRIREQLAFLPDGIFICLYDKFSFVPYDKLQIELSSTLYQAGSKSQPQEYQVIHLTTEDGLNIMYMYSY